MRKFEPGGYRIEEYGRPNSAVFWLQQICPTCPGPLAKSRVVFLGGALESSSCTAYASRSAASRRGRAANAPMAFASAIAFNSTTVVSSFVLAAMSDKTNLAALTLAIDYDGSR